MARLVAGVGRSEEHSAVSGSARCTSTRTSRRREFCSLFGCAVSVAVWFLVELNWFTIMAYKGVIHHCWPNPGKAFAKEN